MRFQDGAFDLHPSELQSQERRWHPLGISVPLQIHLKVPSVCVVGSGNSSRLGCWELGHTPDSCAFVGHLCPFSPHFQHPPCPALVREETETGQEGLSLSDLYVSVTHAFQGRE